MNDGYKPEWDIDLKRGAQAELFVDDLAKMLGEHSAEVEVKRDAWFVKSNRLFVEKKCFRRGEWRPSGLQTTKAKIYVFVFGPHPGMLAVSTEWLRKAVILAEFDPRNCDRPGGQNGSHPTRGTYVYLNHLVQTRDKSIHAYPVDTHKR